MIRIRCPFFDCVAGADEANQFLWYFEFPLDCCFSHLFGVITNVLHSKRPNLLTRRQLPVYIKQRPHPRSIHAVFRRPPSDTLELSTVLGREIDLLLFEESDEKVLCLRKTSYGLVGVFDVFDVFDEYADFENLRSQTGAAGAMCGRGFGMWNSPSSAKRGCFHRETTLKAVLTTSKCCEWKTQYQKHQVLDEGT